MPTLIRRLLSEASRLRRLVQVICCKVAACGDAHSSLACQGSLLDRRVRPLLIEREWSEGPRSTWGAFSRTVIPMLAHSKRWRHLGLSDLC